MSSNIFSKIYNQLKRKTSNAGSSIILVVVAIAFVGMLVVMAGYMSQYNYLMKVNDQESKRNFYSAEEALAEIHAGLQTVVSNAMSVAYSHALQNNTGVNMNSRKINFEVKYEEQLIENVKGINDDYYNLSMIEGYLKRTKYDPATGVGAKLLTVQGENTIFEKEGGIVLQNVKIMYTDEKGFVTVLSTDIRLRLPDIELVGNSGVPDLENCSIIANDNLIVKGNNNIRVSGNVYAGKNGLVASDDTNLLFDIPASETNDNLLYRLIAGSINVENSYGSNDTIDVSDNYEVWTENIAVDSGKIALNGSVFVKDDLTISGRDSKVTLTGKYYGYGDELYKSEGSSAILVNGANTTLDFSKLQSLMLSGHAYIGARHYDVNSTEEDDYIEILEDEEEEDNNATNQEGNTTQEEDAYEKNDKDLMMGESVGVKSNQLIYLVPTECIGYYYNTTEQYLAKNPMTYEEYLTLTQTYQYETDAEGNIKTVDNQPVIKKDADGNPIPRYQEVNLGIISKKLGKNLSAYGATYKPIFRRINGTVLVYYYLDFTSDVAANEFFADYYKADKANMDSYIKMYIQQFSINPALGTSNTDLHLAGNLVKFNNNGEAVLVKDTLTKDAQNAEELAEDRLNWEDTYTAYSKKMLSSTSLLTSEQMINDIYYNLVVSDAAFTNVVQQSDMKYYENGTVKALAINNKGNSKPYTVTFDDVQNVNLIVATGDLIIDTNFDGLIISGGTVTLSQNCNIIKSNAVAVRQAIGAKEGNNKFADLLLDGAAFTTAGTTTAGTGVSANTVEQQVQREKDIINIEDLVVYENWTKQ